MSDNGVVFIFILLHKIFGTGESYLVDILLNLLCGHPDSGIRHCNGLLLLVYIDPDGQITQISLIITHRSQCFQLLCCINCIRYQFSQEYLMIRVEEFFNDGKNVFRSNFNLTFCHYIICLDFTI